MMAKAGKCYMILNGVNLVIFFLSVRLSVQSPDDKDCNKLYGPGDNVTVLDVHNFTSFVINNPNQAVVVEFYKNYCGICQRYASTWKAFSRNIYHWRDIVTIAVVDCACDINVPLCRECNAPRAPRLRYYHPNSRLKSGGDHLHNDTKIEDLRHQIIEAVEKSVNDNKGGASWPNLKATESLEEALRVLPPEVKFVAVMFDRLHKSFSGAELILDLHSVQELKVFKVLETNSEYVNRFHVKDFPSLYVQKRGSLDLKHLPVKNTTREGFCDAIKMFLSEHGIEITCAVTETIQAYNLQSDNFGQISDDSSLSKDEVYQADLENGLRAALMKEMRSYEEYSGDILEAAKQLLKIMARYFPLPSVSKKLLQELSDKVWNHQGNLTIAEYEAYIQPLNRSLGTKDYKKCANSTGGLPCSYWLMFHTLTVQAHEKHADYNDTEPQAVLKSILGFVKYFFGCEDCSEHFQKMAVTIPTYVTSFDKSVLWLWNAHNQVNARLGNEKDPHRPRIQFPSHKNCPKCRNGREYNEEEVLSYLKDIYTNINEQDA